MPTHFVPTEEIRKLTHGSFEYLAHKIDEALTANPSKAFEGANSVRRIAVYEGYAVVAAPDGRFAKVKYSQAEDGSIKLLSSEPCKVPVYSDESLGDYVKDEARNIAKRFLMGDHSFAMEKLQGLVPYIEPAQPVSEEKLVEQTLASLKVERPWKKLYQERLGAIKSFLGESFTEISSKKAPAKFEDLLKGVPEDKLEDYRELAVGDLTFLSESFGKMLDSVEKARSFKFDDKVKTLGEESVLKTFGAFSEDLITDLRNAKKAALESAKLIKSVVQLGELYDALVLESFHYEVASKFVSVMSEKLRE